MSHNLDAQFKQILEHVEKITPQIEAAGSEEQIRLLRAMCASLAQATPSYQHIPQYDKESFRVWRHNTVGALGLCINTAELLLTDDAQPLDACTCGHLQQIHDTAIQINRIIDLLFEQFTGESLLGLSSN